KIESLHQLIECSESDVMGIVLVFFTRIAQTRNKLHDFSLSNQWALCDAAAWVEAFSRWEMESQKP
ncbi:MAG: hypothetical protein VX367_06065, partial [SAR324 cluster bacterium]|nr:hypothetical protein [SAR324 cluster bacterium]